MHLYTIWAWSFETLWPQKQTGKGQEVDHRYKELEKICRLPWGVCRRIRWALQPSPPWSGAVWFECALKDTASGSQNNLGTITRRSHVGNNSYRWWCERFSFEARKGQGLNENNWFFNPQSETCWCMICANSSFRDCITFHYCCTHNCVKYKLYVYTHAHRAPCRRHGAADLKGFVHCRPMPPGVWDGANRDLVLEGLLHHSFSETLIFLILRSSFGCLYIASHCESRRCQLGGMGSK